MSGLAYRADIDGLRGVAVAAVVLFHLHWGLSGGYVGVDVFFVISGFLITRLILKAQQEQRFSLKEFWMRRVRRLAPAALVMLIGAVLAGMWLMYPRDFYYFAKSALAQVLLASNIHFADYLDYFAGPAETKPLLHTWSLAVEEQFYLLFPLLLVAVGSWTRARLAALLTAIAAGSLALSVWQVQAAPTKAFFLLPTRAWELLTGALLVFAPISARPRRWLWEMVGALGLLGILAAFVLLDSTTRFPGVAALLPCLSTAAVILACTQQATWVGRLLSCKPLVGIGLISYSLYLWHWPILAYLHYVHGELLSPRTTALAAAASLGCGYLSWKHIETPFRQRRVAASGPALIRLAGAGSLAVAAVSVLSLVTHGLPSRWGSDVAQVLANSSNTMKRFRTGRAELAQQDLLPRIGADAADPPCVLIWGDSHAAAIGQLCDELARQHGIVGYVASRGGSVPLLETWRAKNREEVVPWNRAVLDFVRRKQIKHVILVCRWAGNIAVRDNGLTDALIEDEASQEHSPRESKQVLQRGLQRTVAALRAAGAQVWVMKQVPHQEGDPLRCLIKALRDEMDQPVGVSLAEHLQRQRHVADVLDSLDEVTLLDPADHCFRQSGGSLIGSREHAFYSDPSHLSTAGTRHLLAPLLDPVFSRIASEAAARTAALSSPPLQR